MKTSSYTLPAVILSIALIMLATVLLFKPAQQAFGSVSQGSEYHSTTTSPTATPNDITIQTGGGSLGSVVITGAAAGFLTLYDATTSNVNLRTGNTPTSTLGVLASIPASAAAGTYTFDDLYFNGLLLDITGVVPTTTITFR